MNGQFDNKVYMARKDFDRWENAVESTGIAYTVATDDGCICCYVSTYDSDFGRKMPKHIGTYLPDEETLICDDITLFGHYIESNTNNKARLREDDTANQEEEQPADDQGGDGGDAAPEEPENPVATDVDPQVDSAEQVEVNNDIQNEGAPMKMPSSAPIPNGVPTSPEGNPMTLADGTDTQVAQDSSLQFDAIKPEGEASISFESGNFSQMAQMPQQINQKIMTIQKTIMPLAEVALIELLGNNKAFHGENFNAVFNMLDNTPKFECSATYKVELFIGTDIEQADIQHDAKYILDRLQAVPNVQWNRCEINCTDGTVNLGFIV